MNYGLIDPKLISYGFILFKTRTLYFSIFNTHIHNKKQNFALQRKYKVYINLSNLLISLLKENNKIFVAVKSVISKEYVTPSLIDSYNANLSKM